jgi:hypothetical protein
MYTHHFLVVFEEAGLCIAVVLDIRPKPSELDFARGVTCLRLAHLGFEGGARVLKAINRNRAPRGTVARAASYR